MPATIALSRRSSGKLMDAPTRRQAPALGLARPAAAARSRPEASSPCVPPILLRLCTMACERRHTSAFVRTGLSVSLPRERSERRGGWRAKRAGGGVFVCLLTGVCRCKCPPPCPLPAALRAGGGEPRDLCLVQCAMCPVEYFD